MRASQMNGCAECIDMHWKDARAGGEREQRLYGLERGAKPHLQRPGARRLKRDEAMNVDHWASTCRTRCGIGAASVLRPG